MSIPEPDAQSRWPHDHWPHYRWYTLGVLTLVYMANFVDRQILSILANDIKADLAIDDADLGFLYGTAFAIFYALFGIPLGRLADTTHRLRLLSIGLALWSCMTMLSGLAKNLGQLSAARIGVGVGEATANPCAYSLIADWFPARMRAAALSLYSAGLFVGSGLSLVIGGAVVERWNGAFPHGAPLGLAGWQAAFIVVGMPGLLLALWLLTLREPQREAAAGTGAETGTETGGETGPIRQSPARVFFASALSIIPPFTLLAAATRGPRALFCNAGAAIIASASAWLLAGWLGNLPQFAFVAAGFYAAFSWASALRHDDRTTFALTWASPAFMGIVLAYALISYVGYTVTYWAAPFAERTFGLSKTELGLMLGAPGALGGFVGIIAGGVLADRLARRFAHGRLLVVFAAVALPVPLILIGYSAGSLQVFAACNFLVQMATPSALGACAAASQALVRPHMRGTATAIFLLGPTLIGLGFGPFVAGYISEASGDLAYGVMGSLVAAVPALAALLLAIRCYPAAVSRADTP